jgi:hypothetical protein
MEENLLKRLVDAAERIADALESIESTLEEKRAKQSWVVQVGQPSGEDHQD